MQVETTVTTRTFGLILTYPGITSREINATLKETCDINCGNAVNAALQVLKKSGAIIAVQGTKQRSTMYYQGNAMPVLRSPAGQHRKDVNKAAELTNTRTDVMAQYHEVSAELAKLMQKMKDLA